MRYSYKIIEKENISRIIPLVYKLNEAKVSVEILEQRFNAMKEENYACAGVFDEDKLIGITGMWFCTRHYAGKSVELDHVYIEDSYRGQGIGKQFMEWVFNYVKTKDVETIELNTYVQNPASHKFYYNLGFDILGFHFLKKF